VAGGIGPGATWAAAVLVAGTAVVLGGVVVLVVDVAVVVVRLVVVLVDVDIDVVVGTVPLATESWSSPLTKAVSRARTSAMNSTRRTRGAEIAVTGATVGS
jgi:hypothetical protein